MQTFRYGAVLAATVVMSAGFVGRVSAETYKSANGYTITPPAGWTTSKAVAGTEVMFLSPTRENINVVSQAVPKGTTMEQARTQSIALLKRMMKNYKAIAQSSSKLGGQRALTLTSAYTLSDPPQQLRAYQVFTIRNNKLFVFTCTAKLETYAKYYSTFKASLNSVRFTK